MTTDTQTEITGLSDVAEEMIAELAKSLVQLLGVPVEFNLLSVSPEPQPTPEVAEGAVRVSVEFGGELAGSSWLVLTETDAKTIITMMPKDEDVAEGDLLGELGLSALKETMNELVADAASALGDCLGAHIEISAPTVTMDPAPPAEPGDAVIATYQGTIADHATQSVLWEINGDLAENLASQWLANAEPAAQPAATPPLPQPTATAAAVTPDPPGGVIDSVELDVAVELGNVALTIGELLHLGEGSVVTLTQSVGDDVVMLANGTPVASGEVVVVDGTLGFRVSALITQAKGT